MKFEQIPKSIRLLFDIYKQLSTIQNSVYHPQIGSYLSQTNDLNLIYQQWKILTNNRKKGDSIKNINEKQFYKPSIYFGDYELSNTKKLFKKPNKNHFSSMTGLPLKDPIFPINSVDKNHYGQFINNIENNLLSYYSPYNIYPNNSKSQLMFKYYLQKFDQSIPITILLKQKFQLFSNFSINHWDKLYFDMKRQTRRQNILCNIDDIIPPKIKLIELSSKRQFEFININRIDLFKLALKNYHYFKSLLNNISIFLNKFNLNKNLQIAPWEELAKDDTKDKDEDDELIKMIDNNFKIEIIDQSTGNIILPNDSKLLEFLIKEKSFVKNLDQDEIIDYSQQFPYQLNFDKYYMLNIMNFNDQDTKLSKFSRILNLTGLTSINNKENDFTSDVEIVGVRLSLDNKEINRMINEINETKSNNNNNNNNSDNNSFTYEDILKLIHKPVNKNALKSLMDLLAIRGIIKVKQSADKRGLYLLP